MTGMEGNPWVRSIESHRNCGNTLTPSVQATLALVYEQRTANLIALATMNREWYGSTSRETFDAIDARLGLTEGATP